MAGGFHEVWLGSFLRGVQTEDYADDNCKQEGPDCPFSREN